jgi:hypothetical protein
LFLPAQDPNNVSLLTPPPQISHTQTICDATSLTLSCSRAESAFVRRIHLSFPNPVFIRRMQPLLPGQKKINFADRESGGGGGERERRFPTGPSAIWRCSLGHRRADNFACTSHSGEDGAPLGAEHKRTRLSVFVWECVPPQYKSRTGTVGDRDCCGIEGSTPARAK